jgi:hypothetical protein
MSPLGRFDQVCGHCVLSNVRFASKATDAGPEARIVVFGRGGCDSNSQLGLRIMRYERAEFEWAGPKPMPLDL